MTALVELPSGGTFVDSGWRAPLCLCGRHPRRPPGPHRGVDISARSWRSTVQVSETRVADVSSGCHSKTAEVDLLVSRALMEHVDGVPAAAQHIARVIKPGGRTIHFMSGRYAIFALAARWLPFEPLLRVVHALLPESVGPGGVRRRLRPDRPGCDRADLPRRRFRRVTVEWTPAQVDYFRPVLPCFLLVALYQRVVRALGCGGWPPTSW